MYIPLHFREDRPTWITDLIQQHPFGVMVTASGGAIQASHLAFTYHPDSNPDGANPLLLGHLAAANPQCAAVHDHAHAMVIFTGPAHYVSPRWYHSTPSTPTWNYCAVHISGRLTALTDSANTDAVLDTLINSLEIGYSPPFDYYSLPQDYLARRKPGILAFQLTVDSIESQFKMSQNRTPAERRGVIDGLRAAGSDQALAVADIMDRLLTEHQQQRQEHTA